MHALTLTQRHVRGAQVHDTRGGARSHAKSCEQRMYGSLVTLSNYCFQQARDRLDILSCLQTASTVSFASTCVSRFLIAS